MILRPLWKFWILLCVLPFIFISLSKFQIKGSCNSYRDLTYGCFILIFCANHESMQAMLHFWIWLGKDSYLLIATTSYFKVSTCNGINTAILVNVYCSYLSRYPQHMNFATVRLLFTWIVIIEWLWLVGAEKFIFSSVLFPRLSRFGWLDRPVLHPSWAFHTTKKV